MAPYYRICENKVLPDEARQFSRLLTRVMGQYASRSAVYQNVATVEPPSDDMLATADDKLTKDAEDSLRYTSDPTVRDETKTTGSAATLHPVAEDNSECIYGNHVMIKLVESMHDFSTLEEEHIAQHLEHAELEHAEVEQLPIAPSVPVCVSSEQSVSMATYDTPPIPKPVRSVSIIKRLSKRLSSKISVRRNKKRDARKQDDGSDLYEPTEFPQETTTRNNTDRHLLAADDTLVEIDTAQSALLTSGARKTHVVRGKGLATTKKDDELNRKRCKTEVQQSGENSTMPEGHVKKEDIRKKIEDILNNTVVIDRVQEAGRRKSDSAITKNVVSKIKMSNFETRTQVLPSKTVDAQGKSTSTKVKKKDVRRKIQYAQVTIGAATSRAEKTTEMAANVDEKMNTVSSEVNLNKHTGQCTSTNGDCNPWQPADGAEKEVRTAPGDDTRDAVETKHLLKTKSTEKNIEIIKDKTDCALEMVEDERETERPCDSLNCSESNIQYDDVDSIYANVGSTETSSTSCELELNEQLITGTNSVLDHTNNDGTNSTCKCTGISEEVLLGYDENNEESFYENVEFLKTGEMC